MNWQRFFFIQSVKKVTLGPFFRSKNDENCACVTKNHFHALVSECTIYCIENYYYDKGSVKAIFLFIVRNSYYRTNYK